MTDTQKTDARVKRLTAYRPDPKLMKLGNALLADMLLDLRLRISRELADAACRPMDRRSEVQRPSNTEGMAAHHAANVVKVIAEIERVVAMLKTKTGYIYVSDVADLMQGEAKRSARSIWRRRDYLAPILKHNRIESEIIADDPEMTRIRAMPKEELIEEIRRAKADLRAAKKATVVALATAPIASRKDLVARANRIRLEAA